ncbi:MAG: SDR family oxidoreductase [Myxococcales bacterium]|nr:SDR family oxidoreductase [Myxococcales bacterium]
MGIALRNVVVTGAGTGIGRATALRLSEAGARVALLGRRKELLDAVAAEAAGETHVVAVDVRDAPAQQAAFAEVASAFGPLHALVANAGAGGPNEPGPDDRWDEVVRTNLDGSYHSIRAFEAQLAPGSVADPRHVILISSCLARFGVPGYTAYCASKAGLLGMTRALALEWAERGVLVNAICPGWTDTEMARAGMQGIADATGESFEEARAGAIDLVPLKRMSDPSEIAETVAFLMGPAGASFTGQALDPNCGSWMG